jgi:hypothetical protein
MDGIGPYMCEEFWYRARYVCVGMDGIGLDMCGDWGWMI